MSALKYKALARIGLLNVDAPDIGELQGENTYMTTKAYCLSLQCTGKIVGKPVPKDVPKSVDECPDCGNFLRYETKRTND